MPITGNRGEWSETYAFLRLLADGKLFAADEQLNRIGNMFFPIIKIIREEAIGTPYEYCPNTETANVEIYLNDEQLLSIPSALFDEEATHLFSEVVDGSGSFSVERTEAFIRRIFITKLKAPSTDKSDISMQIHDVNTGYENIVGFSIKSELGSPPTLLNAGRTTNFIYTVENLAVQYIPQINAIDTRTKIIDRMSAIRNAGGCLVYEKMESEMFRDSLIMIDSQMPLIVAEMLTGYYFGFASDCAGLADYVSRENPLNLFPDFYNHKFKDMLCAVALGMKPATRWDGEDDATGGYIIVKTDGDVLAFHIYNRDSFRNYLMNNTRLERGSTTRHGFGTLYEEDNKIKIKLNLQIRFT